MMCYKIVRLSAINGMKRDKSESNGNAEKKHFSNVAKEKEAKLASRKGFDDHWSVVIFLGLLNSGLAMWRAVPSTIATALSCPCVARMA